MKRAGDIVFLVGALLWVTLLVITIANALTH